MAMNLVIRGMAYRGALFNWFSALHALEEIIMKAIVLSERFTSLFCLGYCSEAAETYSCHNNSNACLEIFFPWNSLSVFISSNDGASTVPSIVFSA